MKTVNNRQYTADEGKVFIRKSDNLNMGNGLDLGLDDDIENYEEIDDPNPQEDVKPKCKGVVGREPKKAREIEDTPVTEETVLATAAPVKKTKKSTKKN